MDMRVVKRYKGESDWIESTIDDCIEHTVDRGYLKDKGLVKRALSDGFIVSSPFADWKCLEFTIDNRTYKINE